MTVQLTSKLSNLVISLPLNSPDDVMQRNDMVSSIVSNPAAVSPETAVSTFYATVIIIIIIIIIITLIVIIGLGQIDGN